jgi:hypothetical protein
MNARLGKHGLELGADRPLGHTKRRRDVRYRISLCNGTRNASFSEARSNKPSSTSAVATFARSTGVTSMIVFSLREHVMRRTFHWQQVNDDWWMPVTGRQWNGRCRAAGEPAADAVERLPQQSIRISKDEA